MCLKRICRIGDLPFYVPQRENLSNSREWFRSKASPRWYSIIGRSLDRWYVAKVIAAISRAFSAHRYHREDEKTRLVTLIRFTYACAHLQLTAPRVIDLWTIVSLQFSSWTWKEEKKQNNYVKENEPSIAFSLDLLTFLILHVDLLEKYCSTGSFHKWNNRVWLPRSEYNR